MMMLQSLRLVRQMSRLRCSYSTSPSAQEIESYIDKHPVSKNFRALDRLTERRYVQAPMTPEGMEHHLSYTSFLNQPDKIPVAPFCWVNPGKELYAIMFLGKSLAGHIGLVHGGLLAVYVFF